MLISDSVFVRLILTSLFSNALSGNLESMVTVSCQVVNSSEILMNVDTGDSI